MYQALSDLTSQNTELCRRHNSSPNKMGNYECEEMVKMMTDKATAHGKLEAEFEPQKAEIQKLNSETEKKKNEVQDLHDQELHRALCCPISLDLFKDPVVSHLRG
jgi:hypothetical protein